MNSMDDGQAVALVTGANRGIGLEVTRKLAALGYHTYLTGRDINTVTSAATTVPGAIPLVLDVTRPSTVTEAASAVAERFGHLDVLINNAAIHYDTWQRANDADLQIVEEALQTNLLGVWRTTQAFLQLLRRSHHGRIVNVSSGAGSISELTGGPPAYATSKAALNALTRLFAGELAADHILVNAVCPGWTATDMGGHGGRPVSEGAASVLWAANLPDHGPTGTFTRDGRPIPW